MSGTLTRQMIRKTRASRPIRRELPRVQLDAPAPCRQQPTRARGNHVPRLAAAGFRVPGVVVAAAIAVASFVGGQAFAYRNSEEPSAAALKILVAAAHAARAMRRLSAHRQTNGPVISGAARSADLRSEVTHCEG
jgi:hypothetical protein